MSDILERAEKYLEDFGSSGKVADCLVQELVEALKNTSNALGFSEQCRADWAKHTISLQDKIEKKKQLLLSVFTKLLKIILVIHAVSVKKPVTYYKLLAVCVVTSN